MTCKQVEQASTFWNTDPTILSAILSNSFYSKDNIQRKTSPSNTHWLPTSENHFDVVLNYFNTTSQAFITHNDYKRRL